VPRIERTSTVSWEGNVARGEGAITAATSGAFAALPFSLPTRIGQAEGKTSPEELLAAAHGGCITMSLASELTQAGTPPGRLDVTCTIVMDEVEGRGHQIVASNVEATVAVDGLDEAALATAVEKADEGCPFSQLLKRAGATVQVSARLRS
jgi:lipoyl-dependent peroxiredoxin